jgi:uncharacterized protein YlxW (UPF0749 family)
MSSKGVSTRATWNVFSSSAVMNAQRRWQLSAQTRWQSASAAPVETVQATAAKRPMTKAEMQARISLLSDEMDHNEEENRDMQSEINGLYKKIDALPPDGD